jgi:hypothetical protein
MGSLRNPGGRYSFKDIFILPNYFLDSYNAFLDKSQPLCHNFKTPSPIILHLILFLGLFSLATTADPNLSLLSFTPIHSLEERSYLLHPSNYFSTVVIPQTGFKPCGAVQIPNYCDCQMTRVAGTLFLLLVAVRSRVLPHRRHGPQLEARLLEGQVQRQPSATATGTVLPAQSSSLGVNGFGLHIEGCGSMGQNYLDHWVDVVIRSWIPSRGGHGDFFSFVLHLC